MKLLPSRRSWLSFGLWGVALALCAGGVALSAWGLHLLASGPELRDALLEPEVVRCVLDSPGDFVKVIGAERRGAGHTRAAAADLMRGLAELVLAQLVLLVLGWLTLPREWMLPGSPWPRRFQVWLARSGSTTRGERAASLPGPRPLPWTGRQVAGAAIVLCAVTLVCARLGSHIAHDGVAALLERPAAATWGAPPKGGRVLEAIVDGYTGWRWTRLAARLAIALLLGLQLLAVAWVLPLVRRGGGVAPAPIDSRSPRRRTLAGRAGTLLPGLGLSLLRAFGVLGLLVLVLLVAVAVVEWSLEPVLYARARGRLERRLGPLTASRFRSRPASAEARGAALDLISAAAVVRLVDSDGALLRKAVERSTPAVPLPDGDAVRLVLARNTTVLDIASGICAGPAPALDIDYCKSEGRLPWSGFEQLVLSRLLYLRGAAAAVDGDQGRSEAALHSLGVQAAMLEREPAGEPLLFGMIAEKYQLQLLELLVERGAILSATAWRPVEVDLGGSYAEATALHGWLLDQQLGAALAADAAGRAGREPPPLDVQVVRRIAPKLFGALWRPAAMEAAFASGLDWTRTFGAAYRKPFGAMHQALEPRVKTLTFRERLGYMLAPRWPDLAAQLRLLAEARELARCAIELRQRSEAAGACPVAAAPFVESRRAGSGCVVRSRDADEAVKAFGVRHPPPLEWRVPLARRSP